MVRCGSCEEEFEDESVLNCKGSCKRVYCVEHLWNRRCLRCLYDHRVKRGIREKNGVISSMLRITGVLQPMVKRFCGQCTRECSDTDLCEICHIHYCNSHLILDDTISSRSRCTQCSDPISFGWRNISETVDELHNRRSHKIGKCITCAFPRTKKSCIRCQNPCCGSHMFQSVCPQCQTLLEYYRKQFSPSLSMIAFSIAFIVFPSPWIFAGLFLLMSVYLVLIFFRDVGSFTQPLRQATTFPPIEKTDEALLQCPVCLDHKKNCVLVACGHQMCSECLHQLPRRECPQCRSQIQDAIPTYA